MTGKWQVVDIYVMKSLHLLQYTVDHRNRLLYTFSYSRGNGDQGKRKKWNSRIPLSVILPGTGAHKVLMNNVQSFLVRTEYRRFMSSTIFIENCQWKGGERIG